MINRNPKALLASAADRVLRGSISDGPRYYIKVGYKSRRRPRYFVDDVPGVTWQPDVYEEAARLAVQRSASSIIDVGCGTAGKLVALHPSFEIVGIDYGVNLATCRSRYSFGAWLEHDLESDLPLPLADRQLDRGVVVAADVVEHLRRPAILLGKLATCIERGAAVVISTPERNLEHGPEHAGPPPNPAHAREWTIGEFAAFLESENLSRGTIGLTRSNDQEVAEKTILAILLADGPRLALPS